MAQGTEPQELILDVELAFPPAQGKRGQPLEIEVVRPLVPSDVEKIVALPTRAAGLSLKRVSTAHHRLAQLLAKGEDNTTCAMLTGYDANYISVLRGDPAFQELLAVYSQERQQVFVDVLERMKGLAISSLEELQDRLEKEPEKWSKRELMDFAQLCLGPTVTPQKGASGGAAVHINIDFQSAKPQGGQTIDGKAEFVA